MPILHTITELKEGRYKVVRHKEKSGGVSVPIPLEGRSGVEEFIKTGKLASSTLAEVLDELDRTGKVDVLLHE